MWAIVWTALKRYYRIVGSCSVLAGIVLAFFQDIHNVALDRLSALIWPPLPAEQTCVEDYFSDTISRPPGSYLIIVTDMANDPDRAQSILIDRTLRRLYSEDLGSAIQVETIPCTIFSAAGNAAKRNEDAKLLALEIAERAGADVVLWGEVIAKDDLLALKMTHTAETGGSDYKVEDNSLSADFGEDLGRLIATKMLTLSSLTSQEQGSYVVPRMERILAITSPLVAALPSQMQNEEKANVLYAHALALYYIGAQSGDEESLKKSIEFNREAIRLLPPGANSELRARYNNFLGTILSTLGQRQESEDLLEQGIIAYRAALTEWTQDRFPLNWAMTHGNLGNVLGALGALRDSEDLLQEAVAVQRAALTEQPKTKVPLSWANSQNNLGVALATLGRLQGSDDLLEQAVASYRAALTEQTQDRVPLDWARTQVNLGNVLATLGRRQSSDDLLEQSITAYRAALTEQTQERVPLVWAQTQNNLGDSLWALGDRGNREDLLQLAVTAYRSALTERTEVKSPKDWAATQNGLGNALWALGDIRESKSTLEDAVTAFHAALTEFRREKDSVNWAITQNSLGGVLTTFGELEASAALLELAVKAYSDALTETTQERSPERWAMIYGNQGNSIRLLAEMRGDLALAKQALTQLKAAESVARHVGHLQFSNNYAAQFPLAQALIDRLSAAP